MRGWYHVTNRRPRRAESRRGEGTGGGGALCSSNREGVTHQLHRRHQRGHGLYLVICDDWVCVLGDSGRERLSGLGLSVSLWTSSFSTSTEKPLEHELCSAACIGERVAA